MAFGNTEKEGTGTVYHLLVDGLGRLKINDEWTPELNADEAVNDSDKTIVVPASEEWEILSIWVELVTTGTGGTRQLVLEIQDNSADVIAVIIAGITQADSITRNYLFAPHVADLTAVKDGTYVSNSIPKFVLPAAYIIRLYDNNAVDAAADDMVIQILNKKRDV